MLDYATKLSAAYNKLASDCSTATRGASNSAFDPKAALKFFLDDIHKGFPPVVGSVEQLAKLDYKDLKQGSPERKDLMKSGEKQIKAFNPIVKKYVATLDGVLTKNIEVKGKPKELLKTVDPQIYRGVKILKTEIESILARAVENWESFDKQDATLKINVEGNKKTDKIADDKERNEAKTVDNAKAALLTFAPKLKATVAKAAAAAQKIKADPTKATYDAEMDCARNLSQNVNNVDKWQSHPELKKLKAIKDLPAPGNLAAIAAEFGNGAKRKAPDNATPQQILPLLKEFATLVKDVNTTYADVMNGKLASKLTSK